MKFPKKPIGEIRIEGEYIKTIYVTVGGVDQSLAYVNSKGELNLIENNLFLRVDNS